MDIDPEVAFRRKPDLPGLEDYVERLRLYRELSSSWGVIIVNARVSPEKIHARIWKMISSGLPRSKLAGFSEEIVGPISSGNICHDNINGQDNDVV
jgi:hypothetical protein